MDKPVCYTVSKILYHWICNSDKGWWPFVQNGVNEVQRLIPADQWRHCPGSYNPVDVSFRGRTLIELMDNHLWFHGPDWLLVNNSEEKDPDVSEITHNLLNTEFYGISNLIQLLNHSEITHLSQVTAHVLLLVQKLKGSTPSVCELIAYSETLWVIRTQISLQSN